MTIALNRLNAAQKFNLADELNRNKEEYSSLTIGEATKRARTAVGFLVTEHNMRSAGGMLNIKFRRSPFAVKRAAWMAKRLEEQSEKFEQRLAATTKVLNDSLVALEAKAASKYADLSAQVTRVLATCAQLRSDMDVASEWIKAHAPRTGG